MRRRDLLPLALAPFTGCSRRRDPVTVRVLAMPYLFMSPLYLASEQGYFNREGLRVEIEPTRGTNNAIPLLAGGQADAAFYSINPGLINAIVRGARLKIVAGRQFNAPECAEDRRLLGARAAFPRGFTDFGQLKGKRIGLSRLSSPIAFNMDACLAAGGLTRDEVKIVLIRDNEGAAMLASGSLDVLISTSDEIHLTRFHERVVSGPSVVNAIPGYMYSYIVFGQRFLDGDVDNGSRFLRAFLHGARDFVAGKNPKFLLDFVRENGLDPDTPARLCRQTTALDGRIPISDVQRFIDWCLRNKLCPKPVAAADLIDTRFLDRLRAGNPGS
jgi:NitT/TauT family transport system substrate-binding protein